MRSDEGRTVISRLRLSPAAMAPTAHVTVCPAAVQPALAATKSSPAGRVSATCAAAADCGPPLRTVRWKMAFVPALTGAVGPALVSTRSASGGTGSERRERHLVAVVGEVVRVPQQIREWNDRARSGEVGHRSARAGGRQRALDRDHAVLAGAELGMSQATIGKSEPGGAPMLSPVGSKRQTPVPPEIEIAVGGFSNAAGRMSPRTRPPFRGRRCGRSACR